MNEILNIQNDSNFPIDGRELHAKLGIESNYTTWFSRMCEYGFSEKADFEKRFPNLESGQNGGQNKVNHSLTLSMAKEICMLQRTDLGRQIRKYLIEVEQAWNTPELMMARALKWADGKINALTGEVAQLGEEVKRLGTKVAEDKPKVLFADSVSASKQCILVGELAKLLRQNGVNVGQTRMFERLRRDGYLHKGGAQQNMPTQRSMELGLFEIVERPIINPDGSVRVTRTPKVTGKGQVYFINKYRNAEV